MGKEHPRPSRAIDVAVSLHLGTFYEKLARALNVEDSEVAAQLFEGKPFEDWERPDRGVDPGRFSCVYLLGMITSKLDDGKPSQAKIDKTWERFKKAEESCLLTNRRLRTPEEYSTVLFGTHTAGEVFHLAKLKISSLLGDFCWDEAADQFAFGPGASRRLPRRYADTAYKFSGSPETTYDNLALAHACISAVPLWKERLVSEGGSLHVVPGNKVITVPKNYKTERPIAIEPDLNMYIQKGIGSMIRRRLKRVGVDLDSQRENQEMARLGSIFENLATIDLSMASDTVSLELVRRILASDWWEALEQCRSPVGVLPSGEVLEYQKFSSMGNGYTFELESLIFWALASSVIQILGLKDRRVAVYGDDLIVSAEAALPLSATLEWFGFKFNEDKSHIDGPFRESCGKHFYSGLDVTPFFIRERPKTSRDVFLLHNNLYRWAWRNRWNNHWDRKQLFSVISWLRQKVPSNWRRPRIPDGFGDGAFIGTFDEARPSRHGKVRYRLTRKGKKKKVLRPVEKAWRGWEGWQCYVLIDSTGSFKTDTLGQWIKALYQLSQQPSYDRLDYLEGGSQSMAGISLPPKARIVRILVPQFVQEDPFA